MNESWTEAELAYFAGILDGEGCLSLDESTSKNGRPFQTARLRVSNTDARMIQWIQTRFPGKVDPVRPRTPTHKPQWTWNLWGKPVETVLMAVLPYLVTKHEQAELLIEQRRTVLPRGQQNGWRKNERGLSQETLTRRDALKARMTVLNQRGIAS